jgi:hypothetical protein
MERRPQKLELLRAQVAHFVQVAPVRSAVLEGGRLSRSALAEVQKFVHQSFAAFLQFLLQELPSLGCGNFLDYFDCPVFCRGAGRCRVGRSSTIEFIRTELN